MILKWHSSVSVKILRSLDNNHLNRLFPNFSCSTNEMTFLCNNLEESKLVIFKCTFYHCISTSSSYDCFALQAESVFVYILASIWYVAIDSVFVHVLASIQYLAIDTLYKRKLRAGSYLKLEKAG